MAKISLREAYIKKNKQERILVESELKNHLENNYFSIEEFIENNQDLFLESLEKINSALESCQLTETINCIEGMWAALQEANKLGEKTAIKQQFSKLLSLYSDIGEQIKEKTSESLMFEDVLRPYVTSPINEKIKEELNNLSEEKRTALAKEFTKIKRPIVLENASKKLNEAMEDYLKSMQANMSKMNNLLKQLNDIATKNGMANLSQSIQNAQKTFSSTVMNQLASNPNELKTKTSQIASAETFTLILTRFLSDLKSIVFQIPTFKEWLENGDPNSKLGETLGQNSEEFKNAIIGLFDKAKSVAGRGLMAWLKQKFSFGGADAQNALEHFGYSGEKAYQDLAGLSNKQFKEMIQTGAVSAPQAVNIAKEAPSAETISKSSANPTRTPVDIANEFAAVIPTLDKATRQNVFSIVKKAIDASKQNLT